MSISVSEVGPFERLVSFTIIEADLEQAKNKAARKLAREVRIPGFRPGRAPRKVVEAALGLERIRSEAIDDILPEKVGEILEAQGLEAAVPPSLDALRDVEGGFEVDVKVALWPVLDTVPRYVGREVTVDSPVVTDDEVEEQVELMREQFADVEEVDRAAADGDYVVLNLTGSQDGVPVEEVNADGLFYELGSGMLLEGLDDHLPGIAKGGIVEFDGELPQGFGERAGEAVTFKVLVSEVREKRLPEFTDEWVSGVTEFDTVEDFTTTLRRRLGQRKLESIHETYRRSLLDAVSGDVEVEIPAGIVRAEMDDLLHRFVHRLEEQNVTLDDYFKATGLKQEEFVGDLNDQAAYTVRINLALDAIAEDAGLEVTRDELHGAVEALKAMVGPESGELHLEGTPQEKRISTDILRQKAMETLLGSAVPVDGSGGAIDFKALAVELQEPEEEDDDDVADATDEVVDSDVDNEDTDAATEDEEE